MPTGSFGFTDIKGGFGGFQKAIDDANSIMLQARSLTDELVNELGIIEEQSIDDPAVKDFTAPTETPYSSTLKDQVRDGLSDEIENGTYGLDAQDEADLWNRERDREQVNAQSTTEEVKRQFAMTGFPVPPGVMNKAIERTIEASTQKISSVNRDISLKRADLLFQGKQFAWSKALELEAVLMKLYDALQNRALDAAKADAQTSIEKAKVILSSVIESAKLLHAKGVAFLEAHARLAAAAMSMMNLNVSIGAHASESESLSASASTSFNESASSSISSSTTTIIQG